MTPGAGAPGAEVGLPGPYLRVGRFSPPAYRVFGLSGLALGIGHAAVVCRLTGVALTVLAATTVVALLVAVAVVTARVVAGGVGDLVWSEHEAGALVAALAVGAIAGDPLPLLDAVAAGLMVILAVGRIGCLLAGCCHGRPARRGVRYRRAHAVGGRFPADLVGVPLVPVQVAEGVWVALLAAVGGVLAAAAVPPGAVLVAVLGARAAGRIVAERFRGDQIRLAFRPTLWAVGSAVILLAGTAVGLLPAGAWTVAPAAALAVAAAVGVAGSAAPGRRRQHRPPASSESSVDARP